MYRNIKCLIATAFIVWFSLSSAAHARLIGVSTGDKDFAGRQVVCAHYASSWSSGRRMYGSTETECNLSIHYATQGVQVTARQLPISTLNDTGTASWEGVARNYTGARAITSVACTPNTLNRVLVKDKYHGGLLNSSWKFHRPYPPVWRIMGIHYC